MVIIRRLDHVQVCIPVGKEAEARSFYGGILGLKEIPKPESLISNGGLWYEIGDIQLHLGVEQMDRETSKRHPAFEVENLEEVRKYLEKHGVKAQDEKPIPNVNRFSFFDPFGNRIEFLEKGSTQESLTMDENMETKKAVQAQFGKSAAAYVTSKGHAKGADLQKLVEIAGVQASDIILDVATGGGHVANALAPLAKWITAFDITPEILTVAEEFIKSNGHKNVDFVQGDAEEMPFEDQSFDVVTCRIAPHHFPKINRFIEETYRVLKPGGSFLLIDNVTAEDDEVDRFYNEVEKRRDYSHYRAWKKSEWLRMLEDQGFVVEEWYRFTKVFGFDTWCDRMNLSKEEKDALTDMLINAPIKVKEKLQIKVENGKVLSFMGESVLLKAVKPMFSLKEKTGPHEESMVW